MAKLLGHLQHAALVGGFIGLLMLARGEISGPVDAAVTLAFGVGGAVAVMAAFEAVSMFFRWLFTGRLLAPAPAPLARKSVDLEAAWAESYVDGLASRRPSENKVRQHPRQENET